MPIGSARVHGDGADLVIVTFGNGLRMSLRAAARLASADSFVPLGDAAAHVLLSEAAIEAAAWDIVR